MRADPNGAVELGEVIGREGEVDRLWSLLIQSNVVLNGRCGIGKTTLTRLALADAPTGWRGHRVELAQVRGAAMLSAAILDALRHEPDAGESVQAAIAPVLNAGGEIDPAKLSGNPGARLRQALDAELDERNVGLVLALDDFDTFIAAAAGSPEHSEGLSALFDALAAMSGGQTRVRLLLITNTHLGRGLERVEGSVSPTLFESCTNETLEALRPEGGARLVSSLLLGESITARDRAALARTLAENCDHVPRWIHCAMAHFVARGKPILDGDLERCMVEAVSDLQREPWRLERELRPVLEDYVQPQRGLALSILDQLALGEEQAMTFSQIARQIAMETKIDDDALERVVEELRGDQIIEELGGQLKFCGELLRMAWLKQRFM